MSCVLRSNRHVWMAAMLAGATLVAPSACAAAAALTKLGEVVEAKGSDTMETSPVLYQDRQLLLECYRHEPSAQSGNMYLRLKDLQTGQVLSQFGDGYGFGCAVANNSQLNVFATKAGSIYRFTSTDMTTWSAPVMVIAPSGTHVLYNSSVCRDDQGYVMAYEQDQPGSYCFKFARSTDLAHWQTVDVPAFAGPSGHQYSACPMIRYSNGYYYTLYLAEGAPPYGGEYVTNIIRSKDLTNWEYSPNNPVLGASAGEGSNNSDVDLFEVNGKTYVFYADGDQQTWCEVKKAVYDGTTSEFLASYFSVPEPSSYVLLTTAVLALSAYLWRKRSR